MVEWRGLARVVVVVLGRGDQVALIRAVGGVPTHGGHGRHDTRVGRRRGTLIVLAVTREEAAVAVVATATTTSCLWGQRAEAVLIHHGPVIAVAA